MVFGPLPLFSIFSIVVGERAAPARASTTAKARK
jgi:hypothetical protein